MSVILSITNISHAGPRRVQMLSKIPPHTSLSFHLGKHCPCSGLSWPNTPHTLWQALHVPNSAQSP